MIYIAKVNEAIKMKVNDRMQEAENGRVAFPRGAKARFLTMSEVCETILSAVENEVPFDLIDFTDYLRANPEILATGLSGGDLQSQLQRAVHGHIAQQAAEWLSGVLAFKCSPDSATEVMTDITNTVNDLMVDLPSSRTSALASAARDALSEEGSAEDFERVQRYVTASKDEMKSLVLSLDTSNPPGAQNAAQAWRRLVEIEDQLRNLRRRIKAAVAAWSPL